MKNKCKLNRWLTGFGIALAVAGLAWLPVSAQAQEKGATKLIQLKPIKTIGDAEKVEAGDMVVMSCPKCKDSSVTVVEKPAKTGAKPDSTTVLRHD